MKTLQTLQDSLRPVTQPWRLLGGSRWCPGAGMAAGSPGPQSCPVSCLELSAPAQGWASTPPGKF